MVNYFICSIGHPDKDYDDENLRRCIVENCFVLHENTKQKGSVFEIKENDILILKYKHHFIGYGRTLSGVIKEGKGWSLKVPVNLWVMGNHTSKYGIREAQETGSNYDTVKKIERKFALQKIEEIGFPF